MRVKFRWFTRSVFGEYGFTNRDLVRFRVQYLPIALHDVSFQLRPKTRTLKRVSYVFKLIHQSRFFESVPLIWMRPFKKDRIDVTPYS